MRNRQLVMEGDGEQQAKQAGGSRGGWRARVAEGWRRPSAASPRAAGGRAARPAQGRRQRARPGGCSPGRQGSARERRRTPPRGSRGARRPEVINWTLWSALATRSSRSRWADGDRARQEAARDAHDRREEGAAPSQATSRPSGNHVDTGSTVGTPSFGGLAGGKAGFANLIRQFNPAPQNSIVSNRGRAHLARPSRFNDDRMKQLTAKKV